jgi:RNA-directed DNA polymerase
MISLTHWPKVEDLRKKLNDKAKARPRFRFYSLHDKVYRMDFLEAAYAQCKANDGAPGCDGMTFEDIESCGRERFLRELADEVKDLRYRPQPVRRKLIPKENQPGKFRPLGIPTIKDRIVQQAVKLLLEPIFEADFTDNAHAYRAGRSAQDAIRDVDQGLRSGQTDVVDADVSKYFDTIPHQELMQSVERRIADHKVLWLIRAWLKAPVQELNANGKIMTTGGKQTKQGTPQGGVLSPLLANIYFRRVLKAWTDRGYEQKFDSRIVNYADDFVILTRCKAKEALEAMREMLERTGLTLNETKTRTVNAWEESFDFLGYTFGRRYQYGTGRKFLAPSPSRKSMQRYRENIRRETASDRTARSVREVAQTLNAITRGFWNYFCQGDSASNRNDLDEYLWRRMKDWALHKHRRAKEEARLQEAKAATALLIKGRTIRRLRWMEHAARFAPV